MTKEPQLSLVPHLRQPAYLAPQDSLVRAVETLRFSGMDALPVVGPFGELLGAFDMRCLRPLLGRDDRELRMTEPVVSWMRRPEAVGRANMSLDDALDALTATGETALFIVDRDGRYCGAVTMADILSPSPIPVRPPHIGGMATPWGVYLTNGSIQAGVGNLALIGGGMLMGVMLMLSYAAVPWICKAAQFGLHVPLWDIYRNEPTSHAPVATIAWFLVQTLFMPIFLLLMRLLPLSGYHAAEHQAVHAMERGEMLLPEVVKRMPRVHPRCGTNLMAGAMIFTAVSQFLPMLQIGLGAPDSAMIGALVALFTWRSVGAFLQQHFTTRPANDRQIAAGIAAAEDLQRKFVTAEPQRPRLLRRIWCMGLPQMVIGTTIGSSLLTCAAWLLHAVWPGLPVPGI